MKKLVLIITALFLIVAAGWFYAANKFEKIVQEEIFPKVKEASWIDANLDSAVIEKFHFKVMLGKVNLFSKSDGVDVDSKATIKYNPFNDNITLLLEGKHLLKAPGEQGVYSLSPKQKITFDRAILLGNTNEFELKITSHDFVLYSARDDQVIFSSDKAIIEFSNTLEKDEVYDLRFKMGASSMMINPDSKYTQYLIEDFGEEYADKAPKTLPLILSKLMDYLYGAKDKKDARDYTANYSFKLEKGIVDEYIDSLRKDGVGDLKVFDKLDPSNGIGKFSFQGTELYDNKAAKDSGSITLSLDGTKVNIKMDIAMIRNYNDSQKQEFIDQSKLFISDVAKILDNDPEMNFTLDGKKISASKKLDNMDFAGLLSILANNREISLSIDVSADSDSKNDKFFDHSVKLVLNDFIVKSSGDANDDSYTGKVSIATPNILVDGITHLYDKGIKPLLVQTSGSDTSEM
ncbi:hypothetical protein OAP56_04920, partial [Rickettsiaceae bacterium]|nr:hypothetical protein [Rickettsiaceae bacterium]